MDRENIKRGAFLKEVRTANLLSEKELAKELGIEPSDITVWETGIKFPEDSATLEALARVLNVTKKELQNGEFKKDKKIDNTIEVDYAEKEEEKEETLISAVGKNMILIVLSCIVLFILIVTVVSVTGNKVNKNNVPVERVEVSDEREPIYHEPHRTNEHVIHNTKALTANKTPYSGESLLDYGFVKSGDRYVKTTKKYKIEYYNYKFYLTVYGSKTYAVIDSRNPMIHSTSTSKNSRIASVDFGLPEGELNCDEYNCNNMTDYYKYINLLIRVVGE